MKKTVLILLFLLIFQTSGFAQETSTTTVVPEFYTAANQARESYVFGENNRFGLKDNDGNILAPALYQKIVMTGRQGWIVQKHNKYGLMDSKGQYLIKPKYRNADRILGRYIKLGNDNDFGIYNEQGTEILPPIYTSIDLLYGRMFLTKRNFRYGVADFEGNVLIPNICDDIYMPSKDTIKLKYQGEWYEIQNANAKTLEMPDIMTESLLFTDINFKDLMADTGAISGYSVLTVSDYLIKIFSSISPAHEDTIDELILNHGVDTVGILMKFSWLPKYPVTFMKKYYYHLADPFNGPLSDTRNKLKMGNSAEK